MKRIRSKTSFYLLIISFFNYTGCYSAKVMDKNIFYSENERETIGDITLVTIEDNRIKMEEVTYKVFDDLSYAEGIDKTNVKAYGQPINIIVGKVTYQVVDDTLYARGINKTNTIVYGQNIDFKIALDDIKIVEIEEPNYLATAGCLIGSAGLALLLLLVIVAATYEPKSCEGPKSVSDEW